MENWVHYLFPLAVTTHSVGLWRTWQPRIGEYSRLERMHVRNVLSTSTCMLISLPAMRQIILFVLLFMYLGLTFAVLSVFSCVNTTSADVCSCADAATERVCIWHLVLDAGILVAESQKRFLKYVCKMSFLIDFRRTSRPNVVDFRKKTNVTNTRWNFKKSWIRNS